MVKGRRPLRLRHSWEARCRLVGLVLSGQSPQAAAMVCGMSRATAYRLVDRYRQGGLEALRDRPPGAKHCPHRPAGEAAAQMRGLARRAWGATRALSAVFG